MVVRVKVEVRYEGRLIENTAVANSGSEAEVSELHLPLAPARCLRIPLHALPGKSYRVIGGSTHAYVLGEVLVRVIAEDRCSEWVKARAFAVLGEHEVPLSDKLLEARNASGGASKPSSGSSSLLPPSQCINEKLGKVYVKLLSINCYKSSNNLLSLAKNHFLTASLWGPYAKCLVALFFCLLASASYPIFCLLSSSAAL